MAGADDVLLEMLKGLKTDIVTIRDNHLAHIADDIKDIQAEQVLQRRDIDELMVFKNDIRDCIRAGVNKLLLGFATIIGTALGLPKIL